MNLSKRVYNNAVLVPATEWKSARSGTSYANFAPMVDYDPTQHGPSSGNSFSYSPWIMRLGHRILGVCDEAVLMGAVDVPADISNYQKQRDINKHLNDLTALRTVDSMREQRIASLGLPSIVDAVIARNPEFQDLDRVNFNRISKLYLNELPLSILNSISKRDLEARIEKIMAREYFLGPGFSAEMPCRKRTTVGVRISNVAKGSLSPPDFED